MAPTNYKAEAVKNCACACESFKGVQEDGKAKREERGKIEFIYANIYTRCCLCDSIH